MKEHDVELYPDAYELALKQGEFVRKGLDPVFSVSPGDIVSIQTTNRRRAAVGKVRRVLISCFSLMTNEEEKEKIRPLLTYEYGSIHDRDIVTKVEFDLLAEGLNTDV